MIIEQHEITRFNLPQLDDDQFVRFLEKHDAHEKYIENCMRHCEQYEDPDAAAAVKPVAYIMDAFGWHNSDEGAGYWCDLHDAWADHLNAAQSVDAAYEGFVKLLMEPTKWVDINLAHYVHKDRLRELLEKAEEDDTYAAGYTTIYHGVKELIND